MGPKLKFTRQRIFPSSPPPPPPLPDSPLPSYGQPIALPSLSPSPSTTPSSVSFASPITTTAISDARLNGVQSSDSEDQKTDSESDSDLNGHKKMDNENSTDSSSSNDNVQRSSPVTSAVVAIANLNLDGRDQPRPFLRLKPAKKPFKDMITEALKAYDVKQGSSYTHIENWIKVHYPESLNGRFQFSLKKAIKVGIENGIFVLTNKQANWTGRLKYVSPTKKRKSNLKPKPKNPLQRSKDKENGEPGLTKAMKTEPSKTKTTEKKSKNHERRPLEESANLKKDVGSDPAISRGNLRNATKSKGATGKVAEAAADNGKAPLHPEGLKKLAKRTNGPTKKK